MVSRALIFLFFGVLAVSFVDLVRAECNGDDADIVDADVMDIVFCDDEPFVSGDGSCPQTKFSYNTEKGECEAFLYSGKGGNSNRFNDEESCMKECNNTDCDSSKCATCQCCKEDYQEGDCLKPAPRSNFRALHTVWYFDGKICKSIMWSGGDDSGNNFPCEDLCYQKCVLRTP